MMSIGDFARIGQVSVRMLRHYDRIGLLRPDHVDAWTGYRSYDPRQLDRLNRVIALKELGFTLADVASILDDDLSGDELRGMLRMRQTQLAADHAAATARLAGVEHRLHLIEKENQMSDQEYVIKEVPALRLAARTVTIGDEPIAEVMGRTFGEVAQAVTATGGSLKTPLAVYDMPGEAMVAIIGYEYAGQPADGFEVVEVPAAERAMCSVHLGEMTSIGSSWQALHAALGEQGLRPAGPCRELYVRAAPDHDQRDWVTELQQPVAAV